MSDKKLTIKPSAKEIASWRKKMPKSDMPSVDAMPENSPYSAGVGGGVFAEKSAKQIREEVEYLMRGHAAVARSRENGTMLS